MPRKSPTPRAPLTEDQKQVLRDRLAKARESKRLKKEQAVLNPDPEVTDPPTPEPKRAARSHSVMRSHHVHTNWTETEWMLNPIEDCRARLSMLKVDFETGCRVVGQRHDVNDPTTYRCFVCEKPVPEGRWAWKHDYLDHATSVYKTVVMCSQMCHTVFQNDTRLQQALKDLITGAAHSTAPEEVTA